jgi:hypothetical protein
MASGYDQVRQLIQELSRSILQDHMRNLRHYNELRQLVASGAVDQRTVDEAYTAYAREVGPHYARRIADLTIRHYGSLLELGNEYSQRFYERVLGGLTSSQEPRTAIVPTPIELHGQLGGWAAGRFELSNEQPEPATISFLMSPLRGPGSEVFRPVVMIDPIQFTLPPGEVQPVTIRIQLESELFQPARIYTGTVEVVGYPGVALALSVWASPAATEPVSVEVPAAPVPPPPGPVVTDEPTTEPVAAKPAGRGKAAKKTATAKAAGKTAAKKSGRSRVTTADHPPGDRRS